MSNEIGNIVFAALLLVLGIVYRQASVDIPSNLLEDPVGAAGFPTLVASVIIGLSLILLVQGVQRWRAVRLAAVGAVPDGSDEEARAKLRKSALLFATIVAFLALFDVAGYFISVTLLLLAVFLQSGTRFGWIPVVVAIVGAATFHLFFAELLGVRLPAGIAPF